jgi:hypothetical protein
MASWQRRLRGGATERAGKAERDYDEAYAGTQDNTSSEFPHFKRSCGQKTNSALCFRNGIYGRGDGAARDNYGRKSWLQNTT